MITLAILIGGSYWLRCWKDFGGDECLLIAKLIALIVLFVIELNQADKVLHHRLLWVCLISLGELVVWILLRTYPKIPNTISLLF
jgi:hypothetical protein